MTLSCTKILDEGVSTKVIKSTTGNSANTFTRLSIRPARIIAYKPNPKARGTYSHLLVAEIDWREARAIRSAADALGTRKSPWVERLPSLSGNRLYRVTLKARDTEDGKTAKVDTPPYGINVSLHSILRWPTATPAPLRDWPVVQIRSVGPSNERLGVWSPTATHS